MHARCSERKWRLEKWMICMSFSSALVCTYRRISGSSNGGMGTDRMHAKGRLFFTGLRVCRGGPSDEYACFGPTEKCSSNRAR